MFDGIKTKALLVACLVFSGSALPNGNDKRHWVGTWASMPQEVEPANLAPAPFGGADAAAQFENTTLRQTFHMSIGAEKIRIRFSNIFGKTDFNAMISLNLNEAVTPNSIRDKSPASACTTPQSGLRRSARIKAMREAQLSPGPTPQLERSASRLKATIAAGPVKRRESGTKFLAASIEVEVDGSTSDEEYEEVEECDESGEEDEECEDDDEADEEERDGEKLVWDYVRRKYVSVYE